MSDLSPSSQPTPETAEAAPRASLLQTLKKATARLQDWFVIQSTTVRVLLIAVALLIPVTGLYSALLMHRQAAMAEQVKTMSAADPTGATTWILNPKLPVVFGTGSVLSFLDSNKADQITVIYKALMWNVSERIILIESQGKLYAYYPSDMETKIFVSMSLG
jgi:cell division protease FtsH